MSPNAQNRAQCEGEKYFLSVLSCGARQRACSLRSTEWSQSNAPLSLPCVIFHLYLILPVHPSALTFRSTMSNSLLPLTDDAPPATSSTTPAYILAQRAAFKKRYDALPASFKTTPASIRLAERELCRQQDEGSLHPALTIQAQATNQWGVFVPAFTINLCSDKSWVINATIPSRHLHFSAESLEQAYAVFWHEFAQWRLCQSCETTHKLETCLDCAQREALSAPQTCGVCMMERKDMYRLSCGHTNYCRPCLKRVSPKRCPSCRQDFTLSTGFVERKRKRCYCSEAEEDEEEEEYD